MKRRHVAVIHRWASRYAEYDKYLDHDEFAVTYISTSVGHTAIPATAAAVEIVAATDDLSEVRSALRRHADVFGSPAAIVALKEDDLLCAATLRAEWGCPGPTVDQLAPFRNKLTMLETVSRRGIRVPAFADAVDVEGVREFAENRGWPIILKPHLGSASEGVRRISGPGELADCVRLESPMVVQAFVPHAIYHVDGVFDGVGLGPWRASSYVNSCLGFRVGKPLGSVEEDDPVILDAIGEFTRTVLAALTTEPVVFHLEVFVDGTANGGVECTFLEIGARVGGGEIAFVWRDVHGFDLMHDAFRIAAGRRPVSASVGFDEVAGWLLVPAPGERPCLIDQVTSMVGQRPGPYAEDLLAPGTVLPAADSYYEHVGGRFRFRGPTAACVRDAIIATATDFHVAGTSVEVQSAELLNFKA